MNKKFKCTVCGYVHEGSEAPDTCPRCKQPKSKFEEIRLPASLKGTKTGQNLLEAFAGESMARNKYAFFASRAKIEGFVHISKIFRKTAANEKEHAKIWYKFLHDGQIADTPANLLDAANGEYAEWTEMYARMAAEAREEGFDEIADTFERVAAIEKYHEERFRTLLKELEEKQMYICEDDCIWQCSKCGHIEVGKAAPDECPVCHHNRAYFQRNSKK